MLDVRYTEKMKEKRALRAEMQKENCFLSHPLSLNQLSDGHCIIS